MKINNSHYRFITSNNYKDKAIERREQGIDIKKEKNINIEISSAAKSLAEKIQQSGDSQYTEKVEGIRKAILKGSYKVSPEEIAEKMLGIIYKQKDSDGQ